MTRLRGFGTIQIAAALLVLTLTGCRRYGGYGSEEANMEAILRANQAFEQELVIAQRNLQQLASAADDTVAAAQLERFRAVVLAHETTLEKHKKWAAQLSPERNTYRTIARYLGAILAEQEMIRIQYEDLLFAPEPEDPRLLAIWDELPDSRYIVSPPFYERLIERARLQALFEEIDSSNRPVGVEDSILNVPPPSETGAATVNPILPDSAAQ